MEPVAATSADHLTEDELGFLLLLAALGRRRLQRLLCESGLAANAQAAAPAATSDPLRIGPDPARHHGSVPSPSARLLTAEQSIADQVPASTVTRSALLRLAQSTGMAPRLRGGRGRQAGTAAQLRAQLQRSNLTVLWHEQLPACLRAIPDPPWVLYGCGNVSALAGPCIAIVGARAATARAVRWTQQLACDLSAAELRVVSGLALGIDAAAHRGCLEAGASATIAVLGSGADQPTPRQNARLAAAITTAGGLLLSEYAPGQSARAQHFPERNRIISGLALGLLVVEAGERSGSLISARFALEQGRELMAVPGPVGLPHSAGCHRLLRQGATLVTGAAEVLDALGHDRPAVSAPPTAEVPELRHCFPATDVKLAQQLYLACDAVAQPLSALVDAVQAEPARVAHLLTLLELRGFLQRSGTGYYRG